MSGVFTNNWAGMKNSMILGGLSKEDVSDVYNVSGTRVYASHLTTPLADIYNGYSYSTGYNNNYVRFGFSDTTPTADDIDLGNAWSSGVKYVSVTNGTRSWSGATVSRTFSVVIQNVSDAAVTVREFGIFTGTSNGYCLLYRCVLDSPVTIARYESATIEFTISQTISNPI